MLRVLARRPPSNPAGCVRVQRRGMARFKLFDKLIPEDPPELKEYKEREKRIIKEQIGRGKLSEALKAKTEKLFVATAQVVPPIKDYEFPPVDLTSTTSAAAYPLPSPAEIFARAPVTVVTLAFQGHGQKQLEPWNAVVLDTFGGSSALVPSPSGGGAVPWLNLVYLQGWFWKAFAPVITTSMRRGWDARPDLREATAIVYEPSAREADHWCDKLRVHNRMMAHVLLVDAGGHVRWQAHGPPAPGEAEGLAAAARILLDAAAGRKR